MPTLSNKFKENTPSVIRSAQQKFALRTDNTVAINVSTGNVSLPMHPALQKRIFNLNSENSPFKDGVVKYTSTIGETETRNAFKNILSSSDIDTSGLEIQVTESGSHAMELVLLGVANAVGDNNQPILVIDPAYSNYSTIAKRISRDIVRVTRVLETDGTYTFDMDNVKDTIDKHNPCAIIIIPFDNPTGDYFDIDKLTQLCKLAVDANMWIVSDEAYRELYYGEKEISSIWKITEDKVPGITGKRISIETASKVWNACGLRIGAIVSDNPEFIKQSVAENSANLCPSAIGQYIFGALAHESHEELNKWYQNQREHYSEIISTVNNGIANELEDVIVSKPIAALYSVVDFRQIAKPNFNSADFIEYCATKGSIDMDGTKYTFLASPMTGFYNPNSEDNPGRTQIRLALVEPKEKLDKLPKVLAELFREYNQKL